MACNLSIQGFQNYEQETLTSSLYPDHKTACLKLRDAVCGLFALDHLAESRDFLAGLDIGGPVAP